MIGATGRVTVTTTVDDLPPATLTLNTRAAKPPATQRSF
jgi:hypothetical protein